MSHALSSTLAASLALALAAPTAALASTTASASHQRPAHRLSQKQAASMSRKERLKIEGLRRDPDDCVKYGCVGNN